MMNQVQQTGTIYETKTKTVTGIAMLSALAYILMFFEVPIPMLLPSFIKMDFSELPALIAAFAYGPISGVAVCLIKNLIHLMNTQTGGVGELVNFVLGTIVVMTAGAIYKKNHTKSGAMIGSLLGATAMAVGSLPLNYYIIYPIYENFMPLETILAAYRAILPVVKNLWQCLLIFNLPFTLFKGLCAAAITFIIYKPLSPILKGKN